MIEAWTATLDDGTTITSDAADSIERAHERGRVVHIHATASGAPITMACVPGSNERLRMFTRRAISTSGRQADMPVFEIVHDDGEFTRLYVHPEHGLIFSSLDLNL